MKLKIEKGIPVPPPHFDGKKKYPFTEMEVGDCLFVPEEYARPVAARNAAYQIGRVYGRKFRTSLEEGGVRVWRIS